MAQSDIYPQAPRDLSGGFMTIGYSNGTDTHRMRVHVLPFSTNAFIVGGGTPSVGTDDGNHDYAYTPDRPAGMEAGITDTFQAFVNKVRVFFPAAWIFSLVNLYQRQNDGTLKEVFPVPAPTPLAGQHTGGTLGPQARALEMIFNFKTTAGNRARIILIGQDYIGLDTGRVVGATGTDNPNMQGLIAYLSGSATGLVCHDGQKFSASAHVTWAFNRRLRKHYGYA